MVYSHSSSTMCTFTFGSCWPADWDGSPRPFVRRKTADRVFDNLAGYLIRVPDSRTLTPLQIALSMSQWARHSGVALQSV